MVGTLRFHEMSINVRNIDLSFGLSQIVERSHDDDHMTVITEQAHALTYSLLYNM